MFGRGAGTGRGRGRNLTRKARGTGVKAKTRVARRDIARRQTPEAKAFKAAAKANPPRPDLMPKLKTKDPFSPSKKLIKKVAAADRAKARAKAVASGRPAPKTAAQKAMAAKRRANAQKRKTARQARKIK